MTIFINGSYVIYVGRTTTNDKPPMTGNAWNTTYKDGDDWGVVDDYVHINDGSIRFYGDWFKAVFVGFHRFGVITNHHCF